MINPIEIVNCPNCGGHAARHFLADQALIRTQCPHCDYLMIICSKTCNVVEAYAPGLCKITPTSAPE